MWSWLLVVLHMFECVCVCVLLNRRTYTMNEYDDMILTKTKKRRETNNMLLRNLYLKTDNQVHLIRKNKQRERIQQPCV